MARRYRVCGKHWRYKTCCAHCGRPLDTPVIHPTELRAPHPASLFLCEQCVILALVGMAVVAHYGDVRRYETGVRRCRICPEN